MAEEERGRWMRGESKANLDEVVRLERAAMSRVRALGIGEEKPKAPSSALVAHFRGSQ
jgi:hypothetical protein